LDEIACGNFIGHRVRPPTVVREKLPMAISGRGFSRAAHSECAFGALMLAFSPFE
jgi:hypothetical protein